MGLLIIVIMFVLIAIGVPITFSLGIAALAFFLNQDVSLVTFTQRVAVSVDSFPLLAMPFFILAGNIMNNGGITRRIFRFANSIVGHIKGGLGYVCVVSSMIFSAMSGSALANAAGLGSMQIKAMKEAGYDTDFSACVIASSAILGPIIPPSVIMIVYGITTGVPISKLFIGAIAPGLIFAAVYFAMVFYYARKNNYPKSEGFRWRELWNSFKESIWALLAPVIILGGIFSGVFTPTESGAIASFYALIISLFVYKEIKIKDLPRVLFECGMTTGVILFIVATASAFGWCLTFARIPQSVAAVLSSTISNKLLLLLIFTIIYLFLGTIMEATPIVITTIPIFLPVCQAMGIDLVFFGVYIGILMAVGTITPPVGTAMFVICKNTQMTIEHFTKIMLPWFACIVCCILLLMFFPQIVLFLPNLLS